MADSTASLVLIATGISCLHLQTLLEQSVGGHDKCIAVGRVSLLAMVLLFPLEPQSS